MTCGGPFGFLSLLENHSPWLHFWWSQRDDQPNSTIHFLNKLLDSLDNFRIWGLRCVCIGAREDNTRVYARPTPRGINAEVWSDCAAGVGENRFPFQFEPRPVQNLLGPKLRLATRTLFRVSGWLWHDMTTNCRPNNPAETVLPKRACHGDF